MTHNMPSQYYNDIALSPESRDSSAAAITSRNISNEFNGIKVVSVS